MINIKDMNIKDYSVMPQKILQFGEGNFLRAFLISWFKNLMITICWAAV